MPTKTKQQNNIPKLRFPGFPGAWEEEKLGNVFNIQVGGDIGGVGKNNLICILETF